MILLIQVLISVIFLMSSISKLKSLNSFKSTIQELGFSTKISGFGAVFVVVVELLISVFILFEVTRVIGSVLLTFSLLLFSWSAWKALKIKKEIQCNCFGNISNGSLGKKTFLRIIPIGILNFILFFYPKDATIIGQSWLEITSAVFSSIGVFIIFSLIITYYNVTSILHRR